jgi:transcriptional regulator with XRE-family HTH domain
MEIDEKILKLFVGACINSGLQQSEIADRAGIDKINLNRIINGKRKSITAETIAKVAKVLNLPASYFFGEIYQSPMDKLQTQTPDIHIHCGDVQPDVDLSAGFKVVPIFASRAAATPDVLDIASNDIEAWAVIRGKFQSDRLHAFKVRGYSMEPYLHEDDYVVVEHNGGVPYERLNPEAVYLCQVDDGFGGVGLALKRAALADKKFLVLSSDNKMFPPRVVDLEKINYNPIMGKVVMMWREM